MDTPSQAPEPKFLRRKTQAPVSLVLYKFDTCPFCQRVMAHAQSLGLNLPMQDTRRDPGAADTLRKLSGRTQVPCLVIDGVPMLESDAIARFLQEEIQAAPSQAS